MRLWYINRLVGGGIWCHIDRKKRRRNKKKKKYRFSIYLSYSLFLLFLCFPPFSYPIIGNSIPACNESFDGNQSQLAAISLDPAEKEYVISLSLFLFLDILLLLLYSSQREINVHTHRERERERHRYTYYIKCCRK